jgi:hypothetical protein
MPVVAISSERKSTKNDPESGMLVFTLRVIDGEHKGFTGEYRLNLWNKNPQAAEIAGRQLSAICHVTGRHVLETPNASELFNVPFVVQVTPQKSDDKYTEISGVYDMAGEPPRLGVQPSGAQAAPQAQAQAAPAGGAPSWSNAATGGGNPPARQAAAPAGPSWQQQPAGGAAAGKPPWAS